MRLEFSDAPSTLSSSALERTRSGGWTGRNDRASEAFTGQPSIDTLPSRMQFNGRLLTQCSARHLQTFEPTEE